MTGRRRVDLLPSQTPIFVSEIPYNRSSHLWPIGSLEMSLTTRIWIMSLRWLLCVLPAQAQHSTFQMYGSDLGLTNPTILALHQDQQGFLWVSTEGGLFRYDGDRFQPFRASSGVRT